MLGPNETANQLAASKRDKTQSAICDLLVHADSVTSLVAHRYASGLPPDVRRDLIDVSGQCRALADAIGDQDALAVAVAERWWPNRYLGDLTEPEWTRVYDALSSPTRSIQREDADNA